MKLIVCKAKTHFINTVWNENSFQILYVYHCISGSMWQTSLYESLNSAKFIFALMSPTYLTSTICQEEYNIAMARYMNQVGYSLNLNSAKFIFALVSPTYLTSTICQEKYNIAMAWYMNQVGNSLSLNAGKFIFALVSPTHQLPISQKCALLIFGSQINVIAHGLLKMVFIAYWQ